MAIKSLKNQAEQTNPYKYDCIICDITMNVTAPYYQCFCCRIKNKGGFSTGTSVHGAEIKIRSDKKDVIQPAV